MKADISGIATLQRAIVILLVLTGASLGQTQSQPPTQKAKATVGAKPPVAKSAAPKGDPARMRQLLLVWEKESAKLKTLDVGIQRTDESPLWGKEYYKGRAIFQSPNLAWLDFNKSQKSEAGKDTFVPHERILCTGSEFWQYKYDTKEIYIFSIDRKDQKRVLEEGPLPFLFNMKASEAEARYQMDMVKENAEYFVISVIPKLQIDQDAFAKAFLQLNKKTYLPDKIFLISPDGKSTKNYVLNAIRPNITVDNVIFKGKTIPKWDVRRDILGAGGDQAPSTKPAAVMTKPTRAAANATKKTMRPQ